MNRASKTCGVITKDMIFVSSECQNEGRKKAGLKEHLKKYLKIFPKWENFLIVYPAKVFLSNER